MNVNYVSDADTHAIQALRKFDLDSDDDESVDSSN